MKTIVTKRLILRPLKVEDAFDIFTYAVKPNIGPMAGWLPHKSIDDTHKIVRMMIHDNDTWAITLKQSDQVIGTIGLHIKDFFQALENVRELGYALDDTYWGQGIVKEASEGILFYGFHSLGCDKIVCGHYAHNIQSKRVIEKLKFNYTHTEKRKDYKHDDVDVVMYKIDKNEFLEREQNNDNT
ncbi:MAG: GNAT family N-acetyltransferase [Acholeplasmataceae bacterium]